MNITINLHFPISNSRCNNLVEKYILYFSCSIEITDYNYNQDKTVQLQHAANIKNIF